MPTVKLRNFDCNFRYEEYGHSETILFSNSLGTNYSMWDSNVVFLKSHFNILRYDTRGHGGSSNDSDALSAEQLGDDVIELLDNLKLDKVIFCGLSMGGLIGQWLGIHHPNRFSQIILCNTAAKIGKQQSWDSRIAQVKNDGLSAIVKGTAERWFTAAYREKHPFEVQQILRNFERTSLRGYIACCAMVRDADFTTQLGAVAVPTLVICGSHDEVTTVSDGQFLCDQIPDAKLVTFNAAHLSNLPEPEIFAKHIIDFTQHKTEKR